MKFQSIEEIESWLEPYAAIAYETTGTTITLDRTIEFAEHVGNPHNELRIIHIAGTSGKTSTCYYMAALLTASGKKTGLTVSPHIDSLTERVQIDGKPLDEAIFCDYFSEFSGYVLSAPVRPTYFELMMVFAYWVFAVKEHVGYAVIETGLGGMDDSSNIARRADKVCIITDIGLDHVQILGKTIHAIATQKAGIIWPGNQTFVFQQGGDAMSAITKRVDTVGAKLDVIASQQIGDFSARNWLLAWTSYLYIAKRDDLHITEEMKQETQRIYIPARMEVLKYQGKTIIFDGAHNEQKMSAFLSALEHKFAGLSKAFLIAFKQSKDVDAPIAMIEKHATRIVTTEFRRSQDMPLSSIPSSELFAKIPTPKGMMTATSIEGFEALLAQDADVYVVTGSFYLISELRAHFNLKR